MAKKGRPSLVELHSDLIIGARFQFPDLSKKDFYTVLTKARYAQVEGKYRESGEKVTEKDIQREAEYDFPGDSAVFKYLDEVDPKIREKRELDGPWSVGCCISYQIPDSLVPELLRLRDVYNNKTTIREARWFAFLHPQLTGIIKQTLPHLDESVLFGRVAIVADYYARRERIADLLGKPIDTTDLDTKYFVEHNFSAQGIVDGLYASFGEDELTFWSHAMKDLEAMAKTNPRANQILESMPSPKRALAYIKQHPEIFAYLSDNIDIEASVRELENEAQESDK